MNFTGSAGRLWPRLRRRAKTSIERALGIEIRRASPDKHFYPHLAQLRRWSPDDVVFDVGANDGRIVRRLHRDLPVAPRILAFEPTGSTFAELEQRTASFPNVRCFHLALGSRSGEATLYLHEQSVMNSLSADWAPPIGTETVQISTVDTVMREQDIERIHFLKIDTEGHELPVLEGAREALAASRIDILQAEVGVGQLDRGGATLEELRRFLAPMNYLLYGIYNQTRRKADGTPALAYCDAVFVSTRPVASTVR